MLGSFEKPLICSVQFCHLGTQILVLHLLEFNALARYRLLLLGLRFEQFYLLLQLPRLQLALPQLLHSALHFPAGLLQLTQILSLQLCFAVFFGRTGATLSKTLQFFLMALFE